MNFAGDTNRITYEELTTLLVLKETSGSALSIEDFVASVNVDDFLEEGESMDDLVREDPEISFYALTVGDDKVYGFQNCGVDRLFTHDGQMPKLDTGLDSSINQQCRLNHLAWVLSPCGSLLASGPMGEEVRTFKTANLARFDGSRGCTRLQLLVSGEPVSAMQIKNNTVEAMYTDSSWTRQGMATRLHDYAVRLFPDLVHSSSRTEDGKRFIAHFEARRDSKQPEKETLGL